jgi:hypothetical protein
MDSEGELGPEKPGEEVCIDRQADGQTKPTDIEPLRILSQTDFHVLRAVVVVCPAYIPLRER